MSADSASLNQAAEKGAAAEVVCPVCRARFRGSQTCSRCGADLSPLLLLSAHAFRLRQRARASLRQGNYRQALGCAQEAERLRTTPQGSLLVAVCSCLV